MTLGKATPSNACMNVQENINKEKNYENKKQKCSRTKHQKKPYN
jgi:hypothetical protein